LQALNITRETADNTVIAKAITQVHDSVKEGESIVQPLEASGAFPPMVISMIDVGEETGQLPEMLLKIAEVYDDEVDNAVAGLTSMLEPINDRAAGGYRRHHRNRPLHAFDQHHRRLAGSVTDGGNE
jgi:type IV pilus assembly protein PilC